MPQKCTFSRAKF